MPTNAGGGSTRRYNTVLFDFDHTLFDSTVSERDAFLGAMASMGVSDPQTYFETYKTVNTAMWKAAERGELTVADVGKQRFARFVGTAGLELDPAELRTRFEQGMADFGELYDGAVELLDQMAGNVRLGLVTNALSHIQRPRIERVGIGQYFESIVISSEVGVAKPDSGIFRMAFQQLGLDSNSLNLKADTVMIGDSLSSDIQGGANFGIDTCWFNPSGSVSASAIAGKAIPTHHVAGFDEMAKIVGIDA